MESKLKQNQRGNNRRRNKKEENRETEKMNSKKREESLHYSVTENTKDIAQQESSNFIDNGELEMHYSFFYFYFFFFIDASVH